MYTQVTLPGSELSCHDPLTLAQCELLEATEAEAEGKGDCRLDIPGREVGSFLCLEGQMDSQLCG